MNVTFCRLPNSLLPQRVYKNRIGQSFLFFELKRDCWEEQAGRYLKKVRAEGQFKSKKLVSLN
jgi:hypothetical protein